MNYRRLLSLVGAIGALTFTAPAADAQFTTTVRPRTDRISFNGIVPGTPLFSIESRDGKGPFLIRGTSSEAPGENAAVVFNSSIPTPGFESLGSPNEDFGGPGVGAAGASGQPNENGRPLRRIMVVADDLTDANNDDLVDVPAPGTSGSRLFEVDFAVANAAILYELMVIDVDTPGSVVRLYDVNDALLSTIAIPPTGANGVRTVQLGDVIGVRRLEVEFNSTGGVDNIRFDCDCNQNGLPDVREIAVGLAMDLNLNGLPDECDPDCNGNGIPDDYELGQGLAPDLDNNGQPDECDPDCDADGIPDVLEDDCDGDGLPDECEPDCDMDGLPDDCELIDGAPDCNQNGLPDECDPDCDMDSLPDDCEEDCNSNGTPDDCENFTDCNMNEIPDECELGGNDCNSNGVLDECEPDCNSNGIPDDCDLANGSPDCDSNGLPDDCDPDCDSDGLPDACEEDCNSNGTPDDCENFTDCNMNEIPDECELGGNDCNSNGVLDECEPDCNSNGIPDDCDLANGSPDCDSNGLPDDCDPDCDSDGLPDACEEDCNSNGTPDDCEAFTDCNMNEIPDECELDGNDCNSNGVLDECEPDCNSNGIPDDCDLTNGSSDCDSNGLPDDCDPDCDSDGLPDACEEDCNSNGTPDDCEAFTDCNMNEIPDECELGGNDCNSNGVLDECEPDCNSNGIPDDCDIANGSPDCDSNGLPDDCDPDCDSDDLPDACEEDCNSNGTPDDCEAFTDCNMNEIPDECELGGNDCNSNGVLDECEPDCNSNGIPDDCDIANGSPDCDSNGLPDDCDPDCDSDDLPDACEEDCNSNGTPDDCEAFTDCNMNEIPDECELDGNDCNSNGVLDECEPDCNSNGIPDDCDITNGSPDCDSNGLPDDCDPDCDSDDLPDACEEDCNSNGTPDDCEAFTDCNMNEIPDECELGGNDCNSNGVLDECEPDCNSNGIPDDCDLANGSPDCDSNGLPDDCDPDCDSDDLPDACEEDCNSNGTPDDCEIPTGGTPDCDANGIPDECDVANGSPDQNMNGVPDVCDPDCDEDGIPDDVELDIDMDGIPDDCEECPAPIGDCDEGCWNLDDNGGAQSPPDYGFRLDGLFGDNGAAYTFSWEQPGAGGQVCYDGNGTLTVSGLAYGGLDIGNEWDPMVQSFLSIEFVYTNVVCENGNLIVSEDNGGNGYGIVTWEATGESVQLFAKANNNGVFASFANGSFEGWLQYAGGSPGCCRDFISGYSPAVDCPPEPDCDDDGTPDASEDDCNMNGVPDECEDFSDCNSNQIPDDCELESNDCNSNGTPDECEPDCNQNGTPDDCDITNGSPDCDSNGLPDDCDPDCDSDGLADACEEDCNSNGTPDDCESFDDCNGNAIPDECELGGNDCNSNHIPDECEPDCNMNGTPDDCDIANGSPDCDSNGLPDDCDPDCDNDGLADACEEDCNSNGTPDDCESFDDCNGNSIPDECDLGGNDCNSNHIPDECEPDCNGNGLPDVCDLLNGSPDCDSNGLPDDCDPDCDSDGLADACEEDCNSNGTPDDCESFDDCNGNAVPDECELGGNDCNSNHIPDECEPDCNMNGTPDDCDIANGSPDCDSNGLPDDCDPDCDHDSLPDACEEDCDSNGTPDDCEALEDCNGNHVPDVCESGGDDCNSNGVLDECESLEDCNGNHVPDVCEILDGSGSDCDQNGVLDECEMTGGCEDHLVMEWDFDDCLAFGDNQNFSEFVYEITDDCSDLHVSANQPSHGQGHSCNFDAINGHPGNAMCVKADSDDFWDYGDNDRVRWKVWVDQTGGATGAMKSFSFWHKAPDVWEQADENGFYNSGTNNRPQLYGLRILRNGVEVFFQADVPTALDWAQTTYSFEGDPNFDVAPGESVEFKFELMAYAPLDPWASQGIWDLDQFEVAFCCADGPADCNANGLPDTCDADCDADGIPDDCEIDCDADGIPDDCDSTPGDSTVTCTVVDPVPVHDHPEPGTFGGLEAHNCGSVADYTPYSWSNDTTFVELPDGTARLTGWLHHQQVTNGSLYVDIEFWGRVNPGDANHPPAQSPYLDVYSALPDHYLVENGGTVDTNTWHYYLNAYGDVYGSGAFDGLHVGWEVDQPQYGDIPSQFGTGASGRNTADGGSGWFYQYLFDLPYDSQFCFYTADLPELFFEFQCSGGCVEHYATESSTLGDSGLGMGETNLVQISNPSVSFSGRTAAWSAEMAAEKGASSYDVDLVFSEPVNLAGETWYAQAVGSVRHGSDVWSVESSGNFLVRIVGGELVSRAAGTNGLVFERRAMGRDLVGSRVDISEPRPVVETIVGSIRGSSRR